MVAAALLGLGLKYAAPKLIGEAITSGVATVGSRAVAGRAMNFAAGAAGQRVLTKTVGAKMAARIATPTGQKLGNYVVRHDISNRVQGEGNFAPTKNIVNPKAMPSTKDNIDPYGHTLKAPVGPTVSATPPRASGPSVDLSEKPPSGRDLLNQYQQRRAAKRANRGGDSGPTGWMGTGKGWWQQNEQVNFGQAFSDPTKMDSFDVARGPTRAALPLPGRKLGQGIKRGVGQAVAAHRAGEPEPAELDPTMIGKQMGVPSMPTTPTASAPKVSFPTTPTATTIPPIPTNDAWKNMKPGTRVGNFQVGTQTATPSEPAMEPKTGQRKTPAPGLGDYGKNRFKEMMNSRDVTSPY